MLLPRYTVFKLDFLCLFVDYLDIVKEITRNIIKVSDWQQQ